MDFNLRKIQVRMKGKTRLKRPTTHGDLRQTARTIYSLPLPF